MKNWKTKQTSLPRLTFCRKEALGHPTRKKKNIVHLTGKKIIIKEGNMEGIMLSWNSKHFLLHSYFANAFLILWWDHVNRERYGEMQQLCFVLPKCFFSYPLSTGMRNIFYEEYETVILSHRWEYVQTYS